MNLTEKLKLFPGGLAGLAKSSGLATTVLYRFAWKEHKKRPVVIASKIADAIALEPSTPSSLSELGDLDALLDAWSSSEPSRVRSASSVASPTEAPEAIEEGA